MSNNFSSQMANLLGRQSTNSNKLMEVTPNIKKDTENKNKTSLGVKKSREQEAKKASTQDTKKTREKEVKRARILDATKENPFIGSAGSQDAKNSGIPENTADITTSIVTNNKDNKISRTHENKNSRVIRDKEGNSRRPVNITLCDDVSEALNILAIRKRERTWRLIDEALRRYLNEEGVKGF